MVSLLSAFQSVKTSNGGGDVASVQGKLPTSVTTIMYLKMEYTIRASVMIPSEFKKAIAEKVNGSICTGVMLWSCCISATETVSTSMVSFLLYDIFTRQIQIKCSLSPDAG